ncbi:MAG: hypothetical protein ABIX46_00135 [Burkholderiaceae bacterium]
MSQPRTSDPREALKQSEEAASRSHPENFKDEENESKQVEIPPVQPDGSSIRGLDPEEK